MKLNPWCYIQDQGDGSAFPLFFNTQKEAEAFAKNDDERLCDDIIQISLVVDHNGQLTELPQRD